MSRENFENFRALVWKDAALQQKLRPVTNREAFQLLIVETGQERGFDFTREEVEAALQAGQRAWIERWVQG